ncbi:hypothetical protein [Ekhidna sp.]|uniref:hypothetical protein n=1 Tax=Ekhidna sp. TaxID=2608089 RepID=UPI003C79A958
MRYTLIFILISSFIISCSTEKRDSSSEQSKEINNPSEPETEKPIEKLKLGIIQTNLKGDTINFDDPFTARICFDYDSRTGWKVDDSDSLENLSMTICFDNRTLGTIELLKKWPYDCTYMNDKKFVIKNSSQIPKVGKPTMQFAGWPYHMVYRPVVINSQPYYKDPLKWRPFVPSESDSTLIHEWLSEEYFQSDTAIINKILKSYSTADRTRKLVNLHLNDGFQIKIPYKEQFKIYDGEAFTPYARYNLWFLIRDDNEVQQISPFLTLVDAGDYNNNDQVEVIFMIQDYNYDGFVMYYNDFEDLVQYGWRYH